MGIYLNPTIDNLKDSLNQESYVDKSKLIGYTNGVIKTEQKYVCVSIPGRFRKSMIANILSAYYSRKTDEKHLFQDLIISQNPTFEKHINQYNVIFLNMQDFLSQFHDVTQMRERIEKSVLWDLVNAYPDIPYFDSTDLVRTLMDIYMNTKIPFIFIIDEWDCIFCEEEYDVHEQRCYMDFLYYLLKDKTYVGLAYMLGVRTEDDARVFL